MAKKAGQKLSLRITLIRKKGERIDGTALGGAGKLTKHLWTES
jgi:hypothetical protein